jgi:DNA-binding ferritin-like protein
MEKAVKIASLYIATLRAMSIIHQSNHWKSKGNSFYGHHLLFERIYNSALENLDLAAEKFVGLFGEECLDYQFQNKLIFGVLSEYNDLSEKPFEQSLTIEKAFLKLSAGAYDAFDDEDKLSLGLDDFLMKVASEREEAVYLLQQTMKPKTKDSK